MRTINASDEEIIVEKGPVEIFVRIPSAKVDGEEQDDDYRLKLPRGSQTEISFQLETEDGFVIPLGSSDPDDKSGHFAVPLSQLNGPVIDSLELDFVNGKAILTETWTQSGEFVITEELINTYIDNKKQIFKFKGIAFSVHRKGA